MPWPKNEKLQEMHAMYEQGFSLSQVAEFYGCTRQSVFGLFQYNGLPTRKKKELPFVVFNGSKYTLRNHGYMAKTDGYRTLLHRDIWEFHNGKIPEGWDIHHRDEDKTHNEISNFECLPKSEHTKLYSPHNNQHTKGRKREKCGS
jgi:hypothetical protein